MDLARFIRGRIEAGDSNAVIAKRLGIDQTTIAYHLALLSLPPVLADTLESGRCESPRTLYELSRLHAEHPGRVVALVQGDAEITRHAVAALRAGDDDDGAKSPARSVSLAGLQRRRIVA